MMENEVIIDGVNVAECEFIVNSIPADCDIDTCFCYENPNCYFKQLQRAKAENEKLKAIAGVYSVRLMEKYKQALEVIKILNSTCAGCPNPHVCGVCANAEGKPYGSYTIANEVLNEK